MQFQPRIQKMVRPTGKSVVCFISSLENESSLFMNRIEKPLEESLISTASIKI